LGHVLFSKVGLEIEINSRAVRWIFSGRRVVLDCRWLRHVLEPIRVARGKQMGLGATDLRRKLFEWSNVVQYPESASVRGLCHIVKPLLNGQPINRGMRYAGLYRLPGLPVIKRHVPPPLRT